MRVANCLGILAVPALIFGGCDGTVGHPDRDITALSDAAISSASQSYSFLEVRIQGFTIGPNGEILKEPDCTVLSPMPSVEVVVKEDTVEGTYDTPEGPRDTVVVDTVREMVEREKEKRCAEEYEPYDGGSIEAWTVSSGGTQSFIGHLRADLEPIDFDSVPDVLQVRVEATPESGWFSHWDRNGAFYSDANPIYITPADGDWIRGVFSLESQGGGGDNDDDEPCQEFTC